MIHHYQEADSTGPQYLRLGILDTELEAIGQVAARWVEQQGDEQQQQSTPELN